MQACSAPFDQVNEACRYGGGQSRGGKVRYGMSFFVRDLNNRAQSTQLAGFLPDSTLFQSTHTVGGMMVFIQLVMVAVLSCSNSSRVRTVEP